MKYSGDDPRLQQATDFVSLHVRAMASKPLPAEADPLFRRLQAASTTSTSKAATMSILNLAFPDASSAEQVYAQRIEHRPVLTAPADAPNARDRRRLTRQSKLKSKRKPKPLSAKEKRELQVYELPKDQIK
jgi:hypothetical protein